MASIHLIYGLILALEIAVIFIVIWIAWSAVVGAPWVPTPRKNVRRMLEIAEVSSDDVLVDLGSGDGRIIIMAAEEFGAKSIGVEVDPFRALWSRIKIRRKNLQESVRVLRKNFFKVDLRDATVVTIYQGHEVNKRIREKLSRDLQPGSRVVSYRFLLQGWTPHRTDEESSIFVYVI